MEGSYILTITFSQQAGAPSNDTPLFTQYELIKMLAIKAHDLFSGHYKDRNDMVEHLIWAYFVVQDSKFNDYVTLLQTSFIDRTSSLNAGQLMRKAFDSYKPQKDKGTWGLSSPKQEQIIALSMQIEQLKSGLKSFNQLKTKLNSKGKLAIKEYIKLVLSS